MGSDSSPENESSGQRPRRFSRESLELAALAAEVIGALAVVITIAFLAVQISDNNKLLESQAYYNFLEVAHHPLAMPVQDPELHTLLQKCGQTPEDTTPGEWERCSSYYFIVYNGWEYTYYQDGNDALPKGLHVGADAYFRSFLSQPGYRRFWPEFRGSYGEPFRSYVEEIFVTATAGAIEE
ncbi:MAG: hypothetical protein Cons2KO_19870 [Congregibacter sp.]